MMTEDELANALDSFGERLDLLHRDLDNVVELLSTLVGLVALQD